MVVFKQAEVMREFRKRGIPTPYSVEDMIKAVIELDDIEFIYLYFAANRSLPLEYIKVLLSAAQSHTNPEDMKWMAEILRLARKYPKETQEQLEPLINGMQHIIEMRSSYHQNPVL